MMTTIPAPRGWSICFYDFVYDFVYDGDSDGDGDGDKYVQVQQPQHPVLWAFAFAEGFSSEAAGQSIPRCIHDVYVTANMDNQLV